jgi:hypothetical protein
MVEIFCGKNLPNHAQNLLPKKQEFGNNRGSLEK